MAGKKSKYFYRIQDLPVVKLTEQSKSHMVAGQNTLLSFIENPPVAFSRSIAIHPSRFSLSSRVKRIISAERRSS